VKFEERTARPTSSSGSSDRSLIRVYADWILGVTLAVLALTFLLTARQTPSYSSTAQVMVEPRIFPGTSPAQEADMPTEQAVATSSVVTSIAAQALGISPAEMTNGLSVSVPVDAKVLDVTYSYRAAKEAQRRAGALAQAYVDYLNRQGIRQPGSVYLRPPPSGLVTASVISPATLATGPSSPNFTLNLIVAGVVGLALGLGTAVLRDRTDRRVRGTADLAVHTDLPVLGVVPALGRRRKQGLGSNRPLPSAREAYRYLRARIQQTLLPDSRGTLLVTSATAGEGKTTTARSLAEVFAASGTKVILVEGDLRGDDLTEQMNLTPGQTGLTAVLAERLPVSSALQQTGVPGLLLLARGPEVPAPGDLLAGGGLHRVLQELLELADLVIIDSAPILSRADTVSWLRVADATLLVVDTQHTPRDRIADAADEIRWAGGMTVGAAVNLVPRSAARQRRRPRAGGITHDSAQVGGPSGGQRSNSNENTLR
jgi:capsular exopolysaccharide synthesis family protein